MKELAPWDANLIEFTLSPYSPFAGKTLLQSEIKERFGITLAIIERGNQRILAPTRDQQLFPGDRLYVIGSDESLARARGFIEKAALDEIPSMSDSFGLSPITVLSTDKFAHKSIRECDLREAVDGLIVGIEREGRRFLSPDSSMLLLPLDRVWIVGNKALIRALRAHE